MRCIWVCTEAGTLGNLSPREPAWQASTVAVFDLSRRGVASRRPAPAARLSRRCGGDVGWAAGAPTAPSEASQQRRGERLRPRSATASGPRACEAVGLRRGDRLRADSRCGADGLVVEDAAAAAASAPSASKQMPVTRHCLAALCDQWCTVTRYQRYLPALPALRVGDWCVHAPRVVNETAVVVGVRRADWQVFIRRHARNLLCMNQAWPSISRSLPQLLHELAQVIRRALFEDFPIWGTILAHGKFRSKSHSSFRARPRTM